MVVDFLDENHLLAFKLFFIGWLFTLHDGDYFSLWLFLLPHIGLGVFGSSQSHENRGILLRFNLFFIQFVDASVVYVLLSLPTSNDRIVLGKCVCPILHVLLEARERRLKVYFFIFQSPWWVLMMIRASNLSMSTSISGFLAANIIAEFA